MCRRRGTHCEWGTARRAATSSCPSVFPEAMFSDYLYVSSASETLKAHFADLSALLVERLHLGSSDLVLDIGCNDASLLDSFRRLEVRTLGVDPAENLAELAYPLSIDRFVGFFRAADRGPDRRQVGSGFTHHRHEHVPAHPCS